ncbi:putative cinnamoyl ester hydrolase [Gracilibacillus halophilus YIM-C55.5]|uniref:Putative cinnamoyl ester hydrolase n=1 Tax=Gracilibacillus halophilus YIM-C55.5 TaxID=1308866 RepID=N4WR68_9BACI|nr:alpha/beta fold hydrolase [Gracilibacillus halophilus]ENH96925.1 putative cinnamoyl ester hydrolase [Gracilibacillus halophilus YIM-C55.5]
MNSYQKEVVKITHRGRDIHGVSYMPDSKEKCPVVIFSHGFNGTNADFTMNSDYLAKNGIGGFCFDFCGGSVHTKSDLMTDEMTIFTEKEDLCAVIETIKKWNNVDSERIFLFGESMGGLVSALVADEYVADIKGLLLLFPALGIADDWNKRFPTLVSIPDTYELWGVRLGRKFFESIHEYNVFDHIGTFNKNVLIFHGDQDEVVPLEYGKKAEMSYPHASIEVFQGEGHGFSEAGNKRVAEMTYEFVKANK